MNIFDVKTTAEYLRTATDAMRHDGDDTNRLIALRNMNRQREAPQEEREAMDDLLAQVMALQFSRWLPSGTRRGFPTALLAQAAIAMIERDPPALRQLRVQACEAELTHREEEDFNLVIDAMVEATFLLRAQPSECHATDADHAWARDFRRKLANAH